MRLSPLPRAFYLGLVYMALHLAAVLLLPDNMGLSGPGPWLPAGLALGMLMLGGLPVLPFVVAAHVLGSWIQLPASAGWMRFAWPLGVCACMMAGAALFRALRGVERCEGQSYPWAAAGSSLLSGLLCSAVGVCILKLDTPPSSVPCSALFAGFFEPLTLGMLLGTPVVLALGRGEFGLRRPHLPGLLEQVLQFSAVFGVAWLAGRFGAAAWPLGLVVLAWMALRRGIPGACLAALVLCYGAARNGEVSTADAQGLRSLCVFEASAVLLAIGAGEYFERHRRERNVLQRHLAGIESFCANAKIGVWEWRAGERMQFRGSWERLFTWPKVGTVLDEEGWKQAVHPEDLAPLLERRDEILRGAVALHEFEYRIRSAPGRYVWVQERAEVVERDPAGEPLRMMGVCLGMPASRSADSEKAQSLDALDSAQEFLLVTDLHGNVRHANRTLLRLRPLPLRVGATRRHVAEFFDEAGATMLTRDVFPRVRNTGIWTGRIRILDADGHNPEVLLSVTLHKDEISLQPQFFVLSARPVEALGKLLSVGVGAGSPLIERAQRHESLRALAGGAVHAFNNVLMAVMGNSFIARKDLPPDAPALKHFALLDQSTQKGTQFCQMLQLCAGRGQLAAAPLDLPQVLPEMLTRLGEELKCADRLRLEPIVEMPVIHGDAALIEKALRHLLANACEAYVNAAGPILVRVYVTRFEPQGFSSPAPSAVLGRGAHAVIEVRDEGPGLEETLHSRAFDPFFTTKQGHKGLGLAEVAGIVRLHGGAIQLESAPGKGWCLRMILPQKDAKSYVLPRAVDGQAAEPAPWRGSGEILVVDDDAAVREVTVSMLSSLGFKSHSASNGEEGLQLLREHKAGIRAVLLDFAMPGMDGVQVRLEIRRIDARLPVIFVSGHGDREIRRRLQDDPELVVITKPFSMASLQTVLRARLGA